MNNLFSNPVDKMNDWDTKNQEKFLELENFSKYPPKKKKMKTQMIKVERSFFR